VAVLDWYSRYVLSWARSSSLEAGLCLSALEEALANGRPEVFNTDRGVPFTSEAFTGLLDERGIAVSMDGRGRVFDNIFSERLWRTVKYEEVHLKDYADPCEARDGLGEYFQFYNEVRPHQALDYSTSAEVYGGRPEDERGRAEARAVAGTPVTRRVLPFQQPQGPGDSFKQSRFLPKEWGAPQPNSSRWLRKALSRKPSCSSSSAAKSMSGSWNLLSSISARVPSSEAKSKMSQKSCSPPR